MKITFTRGTCLGGVGNDAFPGEVRDLPEAQARQLIQQGRAIAGAAGKGARKAPATAPESAPGPTEHRPEEGE